MRASRNAWISTPPWRRTLPKRSNLFQRLVKEVQDLGPGWKVEESRELRDSVTGELREVDIVAEAVVGGYTLLIGIEARDHGRKADVTWVEAAAKKHEHLPTNKVVLWSASGFSAAALRKADALKLTAIPAVDGVTAPWANIARSLIGGSVKLVRPEFTLTIDCEHSDGTLERLEATRETIISDASTGATMPLAVIVDLMSNNPDLRTVMLDHAPEGSGSFFAVYVPPVKALVKNPSGTVATVTRILIGITTIAEVAPLRTRALLHGEIVTTLAEAALSDGEFKVVVREPRAGPVDVKATRRSQKRGRRR